MTIATTDMVNSEIIVDAAPSTTTTTTIDTNTTDFAGDITSMAPIWLWITLAVCFVVLALTVANICYFRKKTELTRKHPEGKENLLADQF